MCTQCAHSNCRGILVLNTRVLVFRLKKKKSGRVKGEGESANGKEKTAILNNPFSINFMKESFN